MKAPVKTKKAAIGEVVLKMDNLKKYYEVSANALFGGGDKKVVKANETLSFEARESETLAIVGESGCGKSTFAKVLMGLETASGGSVTLNNEELANLPIEARDRTTVAPRSRWCSRTRSTRSTRRHRRRPDHPRVIRKFGVEQDPEKVKARVMELLDIVKLPRDFYKRRPRQLSGGQKQRVGIARAFAGGARDRGGGRAGLGARRVGAGAGAEHSRRPEDPFQG